MVLSGHMDSPGLDPLIQVGDNGNFVYSYLIDMQVPELDAVLAYDPPYGMVLMMRFSEDGTKIQVSYYSTVRDQHSVTVERRIKEPKPTATVTQATQASKGKAKISVTVNPPAESAEYSTDNGSTWNAFATGMFDSITPDSSSNTTILVRAAADIANQINRSEPVVLTVNAFKDTVPPVISINGANPQYVEVKSGVFTDGLGASAVDTIDGVVSVSSTNNVNPNVLGTYEIVYTSSDAAGNQSTVKRTVIVRDTTPPIINVNPSSISIKQYMDMDLMDGILVEDNYDSDIIATYESTPVFDNRIMGTYLVTYLAEDSSGNTSTATRTIVITDGTAPTSQVSYSTTDPTNQNVIVQLTTNEPIVEPDGWTTIDDLTYTKTYDENYDEVMDICDFNDNCSEVIIMITNIDKTPPELLISYSPVGPTKTMYDVVATIRSSEKLVGTLPNGWVQVDNWIYQKTFSANGLENLTFYDAAGNSSQIAVAVDWIAKESNRVLSSSGENSPGAPSAGLIIASGQAAIAIIGFAVVAWWLLRYHTKSNN